MAERTAHLMLVTSGHVTARFVMTVALNGWQRQSDTPCSATAATRGMRSKISKVCSGLDLFNICLKNVLKKREREINSNSSLLIISRHQSGTNCPESLAVT